MSYSPRDRKPAEPPQEPEPELYGSTNGSATQSRPHTTYSPAPSPLAAISLRAFLLGLAFGISLVLTPILAFFDHSPFWRLPAFLATLSLFHFLEYYSTAAYNPSAAGVSAFLLSSNGKAYNIAHSMAFLECALHFYFHPKTAFMAPSSYLWRSSNVLEGESMQSSAIPLALGFTMMLVGQAVRTMAMIHAGSNFNHIVQTRQKQGHILVTDGIYGVLRHPSYFGFWWWGLGTQVMLGNGVCLIGYTVVLWRFFRHRIYGK